MCVYFEKIDFLTARDEGHVKDSKFSKLWRAMMKEAKVKYPGIVPDLKLVEAKICGVPPWKPPPARHSDAVHSGTLRRMAGGTGRFRKLVRAHPLARGSGQNRPQTDVGLFNSRQS
jgi:hypothetical protein